MSPPGWSARGDSNPDLHGLDVPRLPIAPRADDGGDHGRIRTATGQALDLLPLPRLGYMALGPSGWTRTTTSRVKSPACCVHTTKGSELLERMAGLEPAPQGLEGPQATVTPHSLWFGLRVTIPPLRAGNAACTSTPRPNVDRCRSPAHRHSSIVKDPALASTSSYRRSTTAPGLEPGPTSFGGRMLPLHHAVDVAPSSTVSETKPPNDLTRSFFRAGQNKKGLPGDRPRRPGSPRVQTL